MPLTNDELEARIIALDNKVDNHKADARKTDRRSRDTRATLQKLIELTHELSSIDAGVIHEWQKWIHERALRLSKQVLTAMGIQRSARRDDYDITDDIAEEAAAQADDDAQLTPAQKQAAKDARIAARQAERQAARDLRNAERTAEKAAEGGGS